jgi:hypothetical protein
MDRHILGIYKRKNGNLRTPSGICTPWKFVVAFIAFRSGGNEGDAQTASTNQKLPFPA